VSFPFAVFVGSCGGPPHFPSLTVSLSGCLEYKFCPFHGERKHWPRFGGVFFCGIDFFLYVCMYVNTSKTNGDAMADNSTRAFTMNMPVSVHKALRQEAFERETSMGEIVVEALLKWGLKPVTNEETSK